ncbi:cupin domain-containing protein [Corynebacterium sp. YIM 101645]|uniref:Cupin domain-containing protein n=1 Tax=Corynebacterium lemuris TaxID=1859292 RepID=A0ABT2FTH7_9CORY|nr:cupin domain-containing protein [Corynebacterium lemuris]MCS5478115.1 cupin domain-containing protein [Corynebacterium lemuris]
MSQNTPGPDFDINKNVDIFTVNRADELGDAPGQTHNARRISGVSRENSAASKIWFGKVYTGPGEVSGAHHHGEAQTGGYVFKGRGYIRYGERYEKIVYMEEGDFVFVPPFMPHIEGNASRTEELIWMTTRTPDNIVVNLEDQDIADIEIDYRS